MERLIAEAIGTFLGAALDPIVAVICLVASGFASTRRSAVIAFFVALGVVVAVKMPVIYRVAERLDLPEPSIGRYGVIYAVVLLAYMLLALGLKQMLRRA